MERQAQEALWLEQLQDKSPRDILRWAAETFGEEMVMATALDAEDQLLMHYLARVAPQTAVFTVDTGRLFQGTHDLIQETFERYKMPIKVILPEGDGVEQLLREDGTNGFQRSVEARTRCCRIRKVEPVQRELAPFKAWITGLRKGHSPQRRHLKPIAWDAVNGLWRIAPLWEMSTKDMWDTLRMQRIPTHHLYEQGYVTIGCAPCNRAIKPGEAYRGGRWWWEPNPGQESGLHQVNDLALCT